MTTVAPEKSRFSIGDRDKTAIVVHHVQLEFICMTIGLKNMLTESSRAVDVFLFMVQCEFVLAYPEDIKIVSKSVGALTKQG